MPTNHDETLLERYQREAEAEERMMRKEKDGEMVSVPVELLERLLDEWHRSNPAAQDELRAILAQPVADERAEQQPVAVIAKIARDALARSNNGRLCTGCSQYLPPERFAKASPDFPTRDGYNFKCSVCAPAMRLERDPVTKKVRIKE